MSENIFSANVVHSIIQNGDESLFEEDKTFVTHHDPWWMKSPRISHTMEKNFKGLKTNESGYLSRH